MIKIQVGAVIRAEAPLFRSIPTRADPKLCI
jgi:hypothetical protein